MTRAARGFRILSSYIGGIEMIAERNPQSEPEREIAAPAKLQPIENKGVDDGAEASEKPAPTEINGRAPEGDLSPLIYPTGWHDKSKRLWFDFEPIKIRGKPLSETVMEDRRAGW